MEQEKEKKKINNDEFYTKTHRFALLANEEITEDKNKKRIVLILFIGVLILFLLVILKVIFTPNIIINGKTKYIINYKGKYKELGVVASYLGKDITDDVVRSGAVNT